MAETKEITARSTTASESLSLPKSLVVEDAKKYFDELFSALDEKTWSFRQPMQSLLTQPALKQSSLLTKDKEEKDDDKEDSDDGYRGRIMPSSRKFIKRDPQFYDLLKVFSDRILKETEFEFAKRRLLTLPPVHLHLHSKWKDDIAQFLEQVEIVKWTMDEDTREAVLEICLVQLDRSPCYLVADYNAIEEPTASERENAHNSDEGSDDDDNDKLPTIDLELSLMMMDPACRKEKLNFANLLFIKNERLNLVNLPLNIWISCLFGMVVRLLTRSPIGETKVIDKYLPYEYGITSPCVSEFPGLDSSNKNSNKLEVKFDADFQLPSQENQIWVSDVNLKAVCYSRFVEAETISSSSNNIDGESKSEASGTEEEKKVKVGKRKRTAKALEMTGQWVKIPECECGLIIYGERGIQTEREELRVRSELAQFIRNKVLCEYIDNVLDPIDAKLRQDAHAFLKMLSFISDRPKNRDRQKHLGSRRWTTQAVQSSHSVHSSTAVGALGVTAVEKVEKLEGRMHYSGRKVTIKISHGNLVKFKRKSQVIYCDTIQYGIPRKDDLTFNDASVAIRSIDCPLLSDHNHPLPVVREFISWIFLTDKEQAAGEDNFRNRLLPFSSWNKKLDSYDFKNLKSFAAIQSLQIIPAIDATVKLGDTIFNAIHQNSSKTSTTNKTNTVHENTSSTSSSENSTSNSTILNKDLCKIILSYTITLVDPLRTEVNHHRTTKQSENDDEDDSSGDDDGDSDDDTTLDEGEDVEDRLDDDDQLDGLI